VGGTDTEPQQANDYYHSANQQYNPYAKQPRESQQARGPNIPDSLKRKFQPPKRGENQWKKQGAGNKKKACVLSNGGGNVTRTSSSRSEDDDEELPEALKGLDKELIEKIQNEIMESGESVSFDDIAGLADAKQTVQELVCWPMKRPDLFTGLRRGPNGLLLFGPPGESVQYRSTFTRLILSICNDA
jgi:SpoVK/Ycf46/Vps4 family AAA+-type ATPase